MEVMMSNIGLISNKSLEKSLMRGIFGIDPPHKKLSIADVKESTKIRTVFKILPVIL